MPTIAEDAAFMDRALILAKKGRGLTQPNPCVGAVLVRNGRIIGEGWHRRAGTPHAEVQAIRDAQHRKTTVAGATLYVTLEPCCTHGRTPPCTELILQQKIKRVVVAATDPNPHHSGRAFGILKAHGLQISSGLRAVEAETLNRAFNYWIVHRRPWVIGKLALSLDGRITVQPGDDPWLTSSSARRYTHQLRAESGAILAGASTVRQDNPALTVRLPSFRGRIQPWRVILTKSGKLPATSQIFTDAWRERTLVYHRQPLDQVLQDLGQREVTQVLIEGGGHLLGRALAEGQVHEVAFFLSPVILGTDHPGLHHHDLRPFPKLLNPAYSRLGPDLLCRSLLG